MSVSLTTVQAARTVFQEGFMRVAQQTQSRFRELADVKTGLTGKSHVFKKIDKTEMEDVTGRLQPTIGEEQTWQHRYLFPRKAQKTKILDEDDAFELALAVAPKGEIITEITSAAKRRIDKYFIEGILGTNYEGSEENVQAIALPNSQIVAVNYREDGGSANTGLTLIKLAQAKAIFQRNEVFGQDVDEEDGKLCMAVSADELKNLLIDATQVGSADYNDVKALVDGKISYFMGIHFIRSQQLPTTTPAGNKITRSCPMWVTNGVRIGFWTDITTSIKELSNPDGAIQIRGRIRCNACRKDEINVVNILCEQAA
jgi:hypothetical protein